MKKNLLTKENKPLPILYFCCFAIYISKSTSVPLDSLCHFLLKHFKVKTDTLKHREGSIGWNSNG